MKVALVFTGGTIGSSSCSGVRSLDISKNDDILSRFNDNDEVVCFHPYTILSENLDGEFISQLLSCIAEIIEGDYDGIIITHGTDTIQYSAAALSYAFGLDTIPIMLLSSNAPLGEDGSNAEDNIFAAIDFIRHDRGRGVFVPYTNRDGVTYIHRGSRLLTHSMFSDSIYSIFDSYYGCYTSSLYSDNAVYQEEKDACTPFGITNLGKISNNIAIIHPYPGMKEIVLNDGITDLILNTYHSGTLPDYVLNDSAFLKQCRHRNIRIWLTGFDPDVVYSSMSDLKMIRILPKMSDISIYVKLWMITTIGCDVDEAVASLGGDIV